MHLALNRKASTADMRDETLQTLGALDREERINCNKHFCVPVQ